MMPQTTRPFPGMVINPAPAPPVQGNWLDQEKLNELRKLNQSFSLSISDAELWAATCNHKNEDGSPAVIPDNDGSGGVTCSICRTHFYMHDDWTQDDIKRVSQDFMDLFNITKMTYLSIDPSLAVEYFQFGALAYKLSKIYAIAKEDFLRYENANQFISAPQTNMSNLFAMLTNPGMMQGMGMGFQPMGMGMNMGTGYQPMQQYPQYPNNGIYGQPMGGYAQQNNQQQPMVNTNMPAMQMQSQQPQQPTSDSTISVNTNFTK